MLGWVVSRVSLVVLAVVTAACRGDDRPAPPPGPATEPGLTAALTEVMTRAVAAADGARRLHREAEERRVAAAAMEPDVPVMLDDDDDDDASGGLGLLAVPDGDPDGVAGAVVGGVIGADPDDPRDLAPTPRPPRFLLRSARGDGGFPPDQVDTQGRRLVDAVRSCLIGGTLFQFHRDFYRDARTVSVTVRMAWTDDDPTVAPRVSTDSALPLRACIEDNLRAVVADAGATFSGLVEIQ